MAQSHGKVLVVDDSEPVRDVLSRLLRAAGYVVDGAANGWEALEYLRGEPAPDLILLDLQMPVMDGPAFRTAQLRDPALASIPVLVVSSKGDAPQVALALGATGYLDKPVNPDRLLEQVALHCPPAHPLPAATPARSR